MKFFTVLFLIAFALVLVDGQRRFGRRGPGGPRGLRAAGRPGGRSLGGARRFGGVPQVGRSQRGIGSGVRACPGRSSSTTAPLTVAPETVAPSTVAPSAAASTNVAPSSDAPATLAPSTA